MKPLCETCANNMDGVCSILCVVLSELYFECPDYDFNLDELSLEDRIGYDMEFWEVEDE